MVSTGWRNYRKEIDFSVSIEASWLRGLNR
jgi:hypothetical protein